MMRISTTTLCSVPAAFLLAGSLAATQDHLAVVTDAGANLIHVIDLDLQSLRASLPLTGPKDVRVSPDGLTAYISAAGARIWFLDLSQNPPVFASGTNPILTSNSTQGTGGELDLTANGRFLLMAGGSGSGFFSTEALIVVDTVQRNEIQAYEVGSDERGVSVAKDGKIVVMASDVLGPQLYSAMIDSSGTVTDSFARVYTPVFANNEDVDVTPDGTVAIGLSNPLDYLYAVPLPVQSYNIYSVSQTPCAPVAFQDGASLVFDPAGDRLFVRTVQPAGVTIEAFAYDTATLSIPNTPDWIACATDNPPVVNYVDRLVFDEPTDLLYLLETTCILVLDANTGLEVNRITDPSFMDLEAVDAVVRRNASTKVRNGIGINPPCLSSVTDPILGNTWDVDINGNVHPAPVVTFLEAHMDALNPGFVLSFGELLINIFDGNPLILTTIPSSGQVDSLSTPVPNDLSLSGFELSAQAGFFGGGTTVICNAVDLVLGN